MFMLCIQTVNGASLNLSGSGTEKDPYLIKTADDLISLANFVNDYENYDSDEDAWFALANDIDLGNKEFVPIGNFDCLESLPFSGNLDGQNHTIKNLKQSGNYIYFGLIGSKDGGIVRNLRIENVSIDIPATNPSGTNCDFTAGAIIGSASNCTIENCSASGYITEADTYNNIRAGGLIGTIYMGSSTSYHIIKNCVNEVNVSVPFSTNSDITEITSIGGIVGESYATKYGCYFAIVNCINKGKITGPAQIGGIAGYGRFTYFQGNCNAGNIYYEIEFQDNAYAGGIIGYAQNCPIFHNLNIAAVTFAPNHQNVTGNAASVGGIAGYDFAGSTNTSWYSNYDNYSTGIVCGDENVAGISGVTKAYIYQNLSTAYVSKRNESSSGEFGAVTGYANNDYYIKSNFTKCSDSLFVNCHSDLMMCSIEDPNYVIAHKTEGIIGDSLKAPLTESFELKNINYSTDVSISNKWVQRHGLTEPQWVFKEGLYPLPNSTDPDINVLASAVVNFEEGSSAENAKNQFSVTVDEVSGSEKPIISSRSKNKILKVVGYNVGLAAIGQDTLVISYKGMERLLPVNATAIDTLMFSGGKGTEKRPYIITCVKDLIELQTVMAKTPENGVNWSENKYFKLANDIKDNFNGVIGWDDKLHRFKGNFNGNKHSINLKIDTTCRNAALFAVADSAIIYGLEVNGSVTGKNSVAGICAKAIHKTKFDSCLSHVNICWNNKENRSTASCDTAGGICAITDNATITNCGNDGFVHSNKICGGLVGYANLTGFINAVNSGSVSADICGGICGGAKQSEMVTCVNYGYVRRHAKYIDGTSANAILAQNDNSSINRSYTNLQMTSRIAVNSTDSLNTDMMLSSSFKAQLKELGWKSSSDSSYAVPSSLLGFSGTSILTTPVIFSNYSSAHDANENIRIKTSLLSSSTGDVTLHATKFTTDATNGKFIPKSFGYDTICISNNAGQGYVKVIPVICSYNYLSGGRGTQNEPYKISSQSELETLRTALLANEYCVDTIRNESWQKYYTLTTNIDGPFTKPIGDTKEARLNFMGSFNGNGHYINADIQGTGDATGIFSIISNGGCVERLRVIGNISGKSNTGAICGILTNADVKTSVSSAKIKGTNCVGGIVGKVINNGGVSDALNIGNINGERYVGGIAGYIDSADVRRTMNAGIVKATVSSVGGLAGYYKWSGKSNRLLTSSLNVGHFNNEVDYSGSLIGERVVNTYDISRLFYDSQMSLAEAISGINDQTNTYDGLLTKNIIGNKLSDLLIGWNFSDGLYPMPSRIDTISSFTECSLAKSPIILNETNKYADVSVNFTADLSNNVSWKTVLKDRVETRSAGSKIDSIILLKAGADTMIAFTSGKDGIKVEKELPVFITANLFSGGNGTQENPYKITKKADLEELEMYVNTNVISMTKRINWSDGKYFSLENDIDADSLVDVVIGQPDENSDMPSFRGNFVGHGHHITMNINRPETNNAGLFGELGTGAVIDSVTIGGKIFGKNRVGGICGKNNDGTISNCVNEADVKGSYYVGGICGFSQANLFNVSNSGSVISENENIGGVCGYAEAAKIRGAVNIGHIQGNRHVGGIAGNVRVNTEVSGCVNGGKITGNLNIGGILGTANLSELSEAINTGTIGKAEKFAGTIIGCDTTSTISKCYFDNQLCSDTTTKKGIEGHKTTDLLGVNLSSELTNSIWNFTAKQYPVPQTDSVAQLAAASIILKDEDHAWDINDDFNSYNNSGLQWKASKPRVSFGDNGKIILKSKGADTLTVYTAHSHKDIEVTIKCITIHNDTTVFGCDSVEFEGKIYRYDISLTDTVKTADGCDSISGIKIIVGHPSDTTYLVTEYKQDSVVYKTVYLDKVISRTFYNDTLLIDTMYKNVSGCDSIVKKQFYISHAITKDTAFAPSCDSFVFSNDYLVKPVTVKNDTVVTYIIKDKHDRDSIIVNNKFKINHTIHTDTTVIGSDSISYKGKVYYKSTEFADTTASLVTGCDSITLNKILICKTTYHTVPTKIACDWIYLPKSDDPSNKSTWRVIDSTCTIVDTIVNKAGCDSIITYNIVILHATVDTTELHESCYSYTYDGVKYTEDTVIDDSLMNDGGCYDVHRVVIHVNQPSIKDSVIVACSSAEVAGKNFTESTIYRDTMFGQAANGCDSIVKFDITINQPVVNRDTAFGCDSVKVEALGLDQWFKDDTTLSVTLDGGAANGCDSSYIMKVHVCKKSVETSTIWGCEYATYTYINGRDSIFTHDVFFIDIDQEQYRNTICTHKIRNVSIKIGTKSEVTLKHEGCETVDFRGKTYTESAEIIDTSTTTTGCDSFTIHKIIVHHPQVGYKDEYGCETLLHGNITYDKDTTIYETTTTSYGCDSTTCFHIHINHEDHTDTLISGCNVVTYEGETFTKDTIVTHVFQNMGGCDSTVNAEIKVWGPSHTNITIDSAYTVTYNGRRYSRSTVIRDSNHVNIHGCDSIVTVAIIVDNALDYPLVVNKYNYMLLCNNNIGSDKYTTYQWYKNGEEVYGANLSYYVEDKKLEGCYKVYVNTDKGEEYFSEEICIEKEREINIYPNPVAKGVPITIDYAFTDEEKKGLYMDVYSSSGERIYSDMPSTYPIVVPGMNNSGYYFILITTGLDETIGAKYIVK